GGSACLNEPDILGAACYECAVNTLCEVRTLSAPQETLPSPTLCASLLLGHRSSMSKSCFIRAASVVVGIGLGVGLLPGAEPAGAAELSSLQRSWLEKGRRQDTNGWVYLHIEGMPVERGFQHGYLLAQEIARALKVTRDEWRHESGMPWDWLLAKSRRM